MTTKRAYKLQEFVAHASNVNCLKIGRKTSRVLVTGGEDHKVNLWAIGKPNAILSLSGHSSAVESVSFDSSEVLVAAGAASGTVKLWDLEEAKIVRTLTGHRSNCISLDFHPFGEFFASGSLDTNLKIWDIRRKGCIHTYKGHTRGVNAIRFTPDGRWVVSGGEDNVVKLWDLTAGKLLHDFKSHDGQIQCIDFHPHEFLLATGSSDRTIKFWDLETFEMIGSSSPEASPVRSMTFNSDGKTIFGGLHESLKVLSWEPVRCHDTVEVGWSRLSDLNVHEGKLLGCSYNHSCVGIWVVDISRVEPYAAPPRSNDISETKSLSGGSLSMPVENSVKTGIGRLSLSQTADTAAKENKIQPPTASIPGTPQRVGLNAGTKTTPSSLIAPKRSSVKASQPTIQIFSKSDVVPVIVPRSSPRIDAPPESRKDSGIGRTMLCSAQPRLSDFRKLASSRNDSDGINGEDATTKNLSAVGVNGVIHSVVLPPTRNPNESKSLVVGRFSTETESNSNHQCEDSYDVRVPKTRDTFSVALPKREKRGPSPGFEAPMSSNLDSLSSGDRSFSRSHTTAEKPTVVASDEDVVDNLLAPHEEFLSSTHSRLAKLQVVQRLWTRHDMKGVATAMCRMSDNAVSADIISVLSGKADAVTLEICTCLLPLLANLLDSKMDRHVAVCLEMLLKLVRVFGSVIQSTVSSSAPIGVDLQAEQRLEWCSLCFAELQKVKHKLPSLTRRGASIAKSAQELNLALHDVT
ncbi:katanin p80 WD40 repeat-containing subunit B1 homolog KTN80.4-like isoform X2 [Wolffia australiana]